MAKFVHAICKKAGDENAHSKDEFNESWKTYHANALENADSGVQPDEGIKTVMSSGETVDGEPGDGDYEIIGLDVFEFDDIDQAVEHAKTCPILKTGGVVMVNAYRPKQS